MRFSSMLCAVLIAFARRHPGLLLVFFGVLGEGVEIACKILFKNRSSRFERILEATGGCFWIVLVIGLAWEFKDAAKTDNDVATLELQTEQIGTTNAQLVASNLLVAGRVEQLRAKNDALEAKQRPRTITFQQVTNFIFLTANLQKFPLRVTVGESRDETYNYAWQLRDMLNLANYTTPDSDTNLPFGTYCDPSAISTSKGLGDTNVWGDLVLVTDRTNDFRYFTGSRVEKTNGLVRYSVPFGDTNDTYAALINAFQQIGIVTGWDCKPEWVRQVKCEIHIRQRPY